MTAGRLHLTLTTPLEVVIDESDAASIMAEDASGLFGLWPGHADFLTVLGPSVLRWRRAEGPWRYCALRGGVLRVSGGETVAVACREAVTGDDLATLEARVRKDEEDIRNAARRTRGETTRLHALAIRRLMRQLGPGGGGDEAALLEEDFR